MEDDGNKNVSTETTVLIQENTKILYPVHKAPHPVLWPLFALQYLLLTTSGILAAAVLLAEQLGVGDLPEVRSEMFSLGLFTSGVSTLIQVLLGSRLPLLEGMNPIYIISIGAIVQASRLEEEQIVIPDSPRKPVLSNTTDVDPWQGKMAKGDLLLAAATHFLLGATGLTGCLLRFIGPVTLAPVLALVGISISEQLIPLCEQHWGISALSIALVIIFSLMLAKINVPLPVLKTSRKLSVVRYPLFQLNAVILAVGISWLFCYVLTVTDVLPNNSTMYGHMARTDIRENVINTTPWFYLPKPYSFGMPTVSVSGYVGMVTVNMVTIMELIGGYFAIARVADVTPPPVHAVNRGITVNGLCCAMCSVFGNVCGNVPYLNILSCIAVTGAGIEEDKWIHFYDESLIASRAVFLTAGVLLILGGIVGKIGAVFTLIPDPVVGGVNLVAIAMLASVGLSLLQHVDITATRNLLIIGLCLVLGLRIPEWMTRNQNLIQTGSNSVDQVFVVLLTNPMFITGFVGCILDNITPGTEEERGIAKWRETTTTSSATYTTGSAIYEFPCLKQFINKIKCCVYCPVSPTFDQDVGCSSCQRSSTSSSD